jgi:hypothetical protein
MGQARLLQPPTRASECPTEPATSKGRLYTFPGILDPVANDSWALNDTRTGSRILEEDYEEASQT